MTKTIVASILVFRSLIWLSLAALVGLSLLWPRPSPAHTEVAKEVWVAHRDTDSISVIDVATRRVIATLAIGKGPTHVAFTPDREEAWITHVRSNQVTAINAEKRAVTATLSTAVRPRHVAIIRDGTLAYVANEGPGDLTVEVEERSPEEGHRGCQGH